MKPRYSWMLPSGLSVEFHPGEAHVVEVVVVLPAEEEPLLDGVARAAVAVGRRVEVVQVRRHLRHAEAAVLLDRRKRVVAPDQRGVEMTEDHHRPG
jgi:hypothetical protein